jgi:regulator of protease activity HflC (stomatin/prohibitin superfamily)
MIRTKPINAMLALLSVLVLMQACASVVKPGHRGLRWRPVTQGLMKETLREGVYTHFPWNNVEEFDVRWQSFTERIDVLTADDLPVRVQGAIILRPVPEEVYFLAQEVGRRWYQEVVKPQFLSAVRGVVANYQMVTLPERSSEIGSKIEAVMVEALKGRHLDVYAVSLAEIEFSQTVLKAIEQKQAKEQEKEQKEFELVIADREAEIARIRAKGEGDSLKIRAEGEAESTRIRSKGQSQAQEIITKTLTPEYLRFKLYDSPNAKMILLPDNLNVPMVINPGGPDQPRPFVQGEFERR